MKLRGRAVLVAVCTAPLVAACNGDADPVGPTTPSETTAPETAPETAAATTSPDDAAVTTDDAAVTTGSGPIELALNPAECSGETVREPNELEASLLVEPGPFSGDDFDLDQVLAAVQEQNPSDTQSWVNAITNQIHGDYLEGVCHNLAFSADLGDPADGPTEGTPPEEVVGQNHFAVVLDASGSMADTSGGGTRMDAAKEAIQGFADDLPLGSTLSLRIYGHGGSNTSEGKAESCESSEVVFEGDADDSGLTDVLGEVEPVGYTPLAKAIGDSAADIPEDASDAIVYVVTDGLETCGGDPVAAAQDLAAEGVEPVVNVIGFEVGNADQQALRAIAQAGSGTFTSVDSGAALAEYWAEENARMQQAWREWREQELERAREEISAMQAAARTTRDELNDTATQERDQAIEVVQALGREGVFGTAQRLEALDLARQRPHAVQVYAGEQWWADTWDASDAGQVYRQGITQESFEKWTELYRKSRGN